MTLLLKLMKGRSMNRMQRDYLTTPESEYEESARRQYRRETAADWIAIVGWILLIAAAVTFGIWIDWSWFKPEW